MVASSTGAAFARIEQLRLQIESFVLTECEQVVGAQEHLDEGTPARAYWHFGYMMALRDLLDIMSTSRTRH